MYLEHAVIHRDANAITSTDQRGIVHIPAASLGTLILGPGTTISHGAVMLLAESGATAVWAGERAVRYYAHGRPLSRSSSLLEEQARLVSNRNLRLAVAREMYAMRFPGEEVSAPSMQQLRGREGARVRRSYREHSERTGVPWGRRDYRPDDFAASDAVNQALSAANTALYGLVHAAIVALGCSPGLGFVHTGHDRSFVYDVADLYKAEVSIPVAFDVAKEPLADVPTMTRRLMRDRMTELHLIERCVRDIQHLLGSRPEEGEGELDDGVEADVVALWDGADEVVAAGTNYGEEDVDW
ncbi:type I-E CRISPR-associated endonuclease Cas1e [Georgenia sp. TF02-10]|nr:type I-E CRISPR-associated endonuclease Cas1e [Georgenia sp. TF02-10]